MGKIIFLAGAGCVLAAAVIFIVYLLEVKTAGKELKEQLTEEY